MGTDSLREARSAVLLSGSLTLADGVVLSTPCLGVRGLSAFDPVNEPCGPQCLSESAEEITRGAEVAEERRGRGSRLPYNQRVASTDVGRIVGTGTVLGLIAWGLDDLTHGLSWMALAVFLTASWVEEATVRNRVSAAWNSRVTADDAPGIIGAPTPAYSMRVESDEGNVPGMAVPLQTGGVSFVSAGGAALQYAPSEILEIDRSLPYNRIQITTTSTIRPVILVYPQSWNLHAWQRIKDKNSAEPGE